MSSVEAQPSLGDKVRPVAVGSDEAKDAQPRTRWRDQKRYAWLLGLIVPLLPFIS